MITSKKSQLIDGAGLLVGAMAPIMGFVYALINPQRKEARTLVFMFFVFMGFCTLYEGSLIDTNRIVEQFQRACHQHGVSLLTYYRLQPEANQVDVYLIGLSWLCSRLITNPHLYLGIVVGLMGAVLTANFYYVHERYYTKGIGHLLLVLLIFIPQAVYYPHRWWMAMQVFVFGALPFICENSYKRIIFCFLSILIHFSYIYLCVLLIAYIFLPKRNLILYVILFYVSLVMSNFDFGNLVPYLNQVSDAQAVERTTAYMHEFEVEKNFLYKSARLFFNVAKGILVLFIYLHSEWANKNNKIFCFTLLFLSFAQFASLNAVGYRFVDFGNFLVVIFYIYYLATDPSTKVVQWFKWLSPVFAYYIIYQIRGILDCIGLYDLIAGNFITVWFIDDNVSVLEKIKSII